MKRYSIEEQIKILKQAITYLKDGKYRDVAKMSRALKVPHYILREWIK